MISIALHIVFHNQFYFFSNLYVFLCLKNNKSYKASTRIYSKVPTATYISTWIQLTIKSAIIQQFYPTNSLPCFPLYTSVLAQAKTPLLSSTKFLLIKMEFYGNKYVSKKNQTLPPPRGEIKKKMFKIVLKSVVGLAATKTGERLQF